MTEHCGFQHDEKHNPHGPIYLTPDCIEGAHARHRGITSFLLSKRTLIVTIFTLLTTLLGVVVLHRCPSEEPAPTPQFSWTLDGHEHPNCGGSPIVEIQGFKYQDDCAVLKTRTPGTPVQSVDLDIPSEMFIVLFSDEGCDGAKQVFRGPIRGCKNVNGLNPGARAYKAVRS